MSGIVIKCDRDRDSDRYVYWSEMCEAPHMHGDRWTVAQYLLRYESYGDRPAVEARLARADESGTSSLNGFYDWGDDTLIVEQRGLLRRERLWEFCEAYCSGDPARRDEWLDLLEPFLDCFKHDSPGEVCPVLPCPDHAVRRD